jgi:plasmid stabilization system protein ParE
MSGYALHPEAFSDLDAIREHIAEYSADAANRVITEIFDGIRRLAEFPIRAIGARTSPRAHCGSNWCVTMPSLTRRRQDRCGSWR